MVGAAGPDGATDRRRRLGGDPAGRGRPRRADADATIMAATLELLGEAGVAGLSMDVVAQRAGVGKATIYRRWTSKEALVLDVVRTAVEPIADPDSGHMRTDLHRYTDAVVERFAGAASDVLPHLVEASCYDDALRQSLDDYTHSRQGTVRRILQRGRDRGELSTDADIDLIVDVILGPFFYRRLLTSDPIDVTYARRLVDLALRT